jgi:rRNA maturation endonuclease Nob1
MSERPEYADRRTICLKIDDEEYWLTTCKDVEKLREDYELAHCPICGGKRSWKAGTFILEHDKTYSGTFH